MGAAMAADLAERRLEREWMDDPSLDAARHRAALRGLARINAVSRGAATLWPTVRDTARQAGRPIRLLDIACGGGDVAIALRRRAERAGLPVTVHGCDVSDTALGYARQRAQADGDDTRFFQCDVLRESLPATYEVVTCSLFLHHLTDEQTVHVLSAMAACAPVVVVNDLQRGRAGLLAAQVGTRLLSRSPVVHMDGPMSVRAAFTMDELRALAERAGLKGADVQPCFAMRMRLVWRRA